jgi:hypothetical protein
LLGLEYFLPGVLREIHPEWNEQSLDGIFPVFARKTAEGEAEIYGQCILITDQTLTAIHVRLQIDASKDEISWLECRLGEMDQDGMVRRPYKFPRLYDLVATPDMVDWPYKVTFGRKTPSTGMYVN